MRSPHVPSVSSSIPSISPPHDWGRSCLHRRENFGFQVPWMGISISCLLGGLRSWREMFGPGSGYFWPLAYRRGLPSSTMLSALERAGRHSWGRGYCQDSGLIFLFVLGISMCVHAPLMAFSNQHDRLLLHTYSFLLLDCFYYNHCFLPCFFCQCFLFLGRSQVGFSLFQLRNSVDFVLLNGFSFSLLFFFCLVVLR